MKGSAFMVDESQMMLRDILQRIYEKGQEEGVMLRQLIQEAGDLLHLLLKK
jgi:hypothetical protein